MSAENVSLQDGFKEYKDFFDKINKEKIQLDEKNRYLEDLIDAKKQEFGKSNSLIQTLKSENEKLRNESETLIKRTEDKLKMGKNALDNIENLETQIFELQCKLTNANSELENYRKTADKTGSINYEMSVELDRLKGSSSEVLAELEFNKRLCDENSEMRIRLKGIRESSNQRNHAIVAKRLQRNQAGAKWRFNEKQYFQKSVEFKKPK